MGGGDRSRNRQISELFVAHYDSLRRLAFVLLGDSDAAEEIVMDVFTKSLSGWSLFRRVEWPPSYMRRMVVNECRTKQRRRAVEQRLNRLFHREEADERNWLLEVGVERLDIWDAVGDLPYRQRACIVLRYLDDLSEQEIADALDCPIGTVKSQLSRARGKLAHVLGERETEPALRRAR